MNKVYLIDSKERECKHTKAYKVSKGIIVMYYCPDCKFYLSKKPNKI